MVYRNSYKIAIFGCQSGLGKYLYQMFSDNGKNPSVLGIDRLNSDTIPATVKINTMIWTAFNKSRDVNIKNLAKYLADNLEITSWLSEQNRPRIKQWIYISSIDVANPDNSFYKSFKLLHEDLVSTLARSYAILRCSAMLGSKPNIVTRIRDDQRISVSPRSTYSFILYSDIYHCINQIINPYNEYWNETYTLAAIDTITAKDIAKFLNKNPDFGRHDYDGSPLQSYATSDFCNGFYYQASIRAMSNYLG